MKNIFLLTTLIILFGASFSIGKPFRHFSAPEPVSDAAKNLINQPLNPLWSKIPRTLDEWEEIQKSAAAKALTVIPELIEKNDLTVRKEYLNGVPAFFVAPQHLSNENRDRILLYIHGGGYVLNNGESGLQEALLMAHYGGFSIVSPDYRLAPQHPYPAALDDVMAVYKELLKQYPPDKIGIFGTSTGGGLTLALILKAKQEGLPLPGAIAPGTPWSDLTKTGDTYYTNEGVDNVLGLYDGLLKEAALAYAGKENLKNPLLSPIYGDFAGFPPVMLTTGTRDLFLSNTVRTHNKLLQADVPASLLVLEGLSHAQYYFDPDAEETRFYFRELSKFFNKYLAK